MFDESCPKCHRFKEYCWCNLSLDERLPLDEEIRKYVDCPEFGIIVTDQFVLGFRAGWAALKDHLEEFKEKQLKR